jgi:hypothetical protein
MPEGEIDQGKLTMLIDAINAQGLHLNRTALVEHGQMRFRELIQLGRDCRLIINLAVELTNFRALSAWMTNLFPSPLPPLDLGEQLRGEKLSRAAQIKGLDDIWRCPPDPLLHRIMAHWRAFKPLVFGQSLLDASDMQGVVRSPFWSAGIAQAASIKASQDALLDLLADWSEFIIPSGGESFLIVELNDLLLSVVAWLADDRQLAQAAAAPGYAQTLARDLTGLRAPSARDVLKAHRLLEAFALGLDAATDSGKPALASWDCLGGLERDLTKVRHLLMPITRRFPNTAVWHGEAIGAAMIPQPSRFDGATYEFDAAGFRASLDSAIYGTLRHARCVAALAVSDELAGESAQLVAAIGDRLVIQSPTKGIVLSQLRQRLEEAVKGALAAAFPGGAGRVTVTLEEHL